MTTDNNQINNDDYRHDEKLDEKLMDHDYDGIKELDNPAPAWIMAIFYITIAFAVGYSAYYFWFDQGDNQIEEYEKAVIAHNEKYKSANAAVADLVLLNDEASLTEGAEIYKEMNCAACHGANGEGNAIGPNLVDDAWIHGCDFDKVFNIIKNGKATKGMTPFKGQLNDTKIQKVSSYIMVTLKGTNPENAKEAQGEICN